MYKIFLAVVFTVIVILVGGIFVSQKVIKNRLADSWICIEGRWVKNGNPKSFAPKTGCGSEKIFDCKSFGLQDCPRQCVVCPPCPECSSISCQTEEFCKSLGFERSWFDKVSVQALSFDCQRNNGQWLEEFSECEYINKEWCVEKGGDFFDCQSACRHDPEADFCTEQCVPVCVLKK